MWDAPVYYTESTVLRCAITDRTIFFGDEDARIDALVRLTARWSGEGIELIQLREKDLPASTLAEIATRMLEVITPGKSILLVNSSVEAAISAKAPGVHIRNRRGGHTVAEVIRRYERAGLDRPIVTVSCHSTREILELRSGPELPDAILFAPVFGKVVAGKTVTPAAGLAALTEACRAAEDIPVLALGGVTLGRAQMCLDAGAAGVAGIRIFHENL